VPASVTISGTARIEAGTTESFTTSVTDPTGLTFAWDYGDGTTDNVPAPQHVYANGGNFHVTLTVSNGAGSSVGATFDLQAGHYSNVEGLLCSGANSGGWCWQDDLVTGHQLLAAQFMPSATAGWVIGREGTLLRTTDWGDTWTLRVLNAVDDVIGVNFQTQWDGVVLSRSGGMQHSSDGGKTWSNLASPGSSLSSPSIADYDSTRIVVTDNAGTQASFDGGATWTATTLTNAFTAGADCWSSKGASVMKSAGCTASPGIVNVGSTGSMKFFAGGTVGDGHHIVILGQQVGGGGQSFVTTDGGVTWSVHSASLAPGGALQVVDSLHAWYIDTSHLAYLSSDNGRTWSQAPVPADAGLLYRAGLIDNSDALFYAWQGGLAISTDFGQTFTELASPEPGTLPGSVGDLHVYVWDGTGRAVVSYDGRFYVTHDAGATWTQELGPDALGVWSAEQPTPHAPAIAFGDGKHGTLAMASGLVQATADGGRTWSRNVITLTQPTWGPVSVAYSAASSAWMTLDGQLWASTDAGATWTAAPGAASITGAIQTAWPDATHGWVATQAGVYATTDGGATWQAVSLGGAFQGGDQVSNLAFANAQVGVVAVARAGGTHLLRTADGGASWSETGSISVPGTVSRTGTSDFWLDSSMFMHSADGGATWTSAALPSGSASLQVFGGQGASVYAFDDAGRLVASSDGGATWVDLTMSSDIVVGSGCAVDPLTVWTVTQYGAILSTATGGL
jgi:photosystem II stability/assembly factor-like uncharacterized protein